MMSLRRIFGLILLFLFFEAVVAVVTTFAYPEVNVFLACVAMTGLAVGVWAVFVLVTRLMMRPRVPSSPPLPRPANPVTPRPSFADDGFSQELNSLVAEANRRLAGALPLNARGEPATVATLPFYLMIGGEGVGKTSAILNSGLEPRLLAGEAAREGTVVPTRLCNLWFAEGAVFADVSGRVVMQEAENWDRALRVFRQPLRIPRWKQVLFGRRTELNLGGLILACDASLFVRANDPQRTASLARTLSDRLQAVGVVFRRDFPVYVVFSKCDGVRYFPEFFAHLSEPEGRRVLGATLPFVKPRNDTADIYADREGKRLTNYFDRLYMALAEKRLVLLAREDESAKKTTAYEFPRELKKLRGDVVQFLLDVFRPNPLQLGPRLRGFYLSGQRWVAHHVGSVAEGSVAGFAVVPKKSDATVFFGSKPEANSAGVQEAMRPAGTPGAIPKWMFLGDLFHNVILKDRAGNVAPRMNTREQAYRNFALAGAGALLLLLALLWANSWRHNRELLNSVEAAVKAVHPLRVQARSHAEALAELESLRGPLTTLLKYDRQGPPLSYRWGLYAGHDATPSLSELYFYRFRRTFMEPMLESLTARFLHLQSSAPVPDDIDGKLKAYRMITSGECKPDSQVLNGSLLPIWSSAVSYSPSDAPDLADKQLQFYIAELAIRNPYQPTISENAEAVERAQAYLRELNGPDRIVRALVEQINHDHQGDTLSKYVPNYGEALTGPNNIEAAYTRDGWVAMMESIRGHKLASVGEPCVVGKHLGIADVTFNDANEREVENLYITNYIQHWKSFLAAHHVEPFHSSADAAQKLKVIADNNRSPLLGLFYMASRNTDLPASGSDESPAQAMKQAAKKKIDSGFAKLFGKVDGTNPPTSANPLARATAPNANDVVREFGPTRVVADPTHPEMWLNSNNKDYVRALEELGNSVAAMPPRIDPKEPSDQQAIDRANKALETATAAYHSLGAMIPNTSSGVDIDVKYLLQEPITYAGKVIKGTPVKPVPPPPPPPPPPPDLTIPIRAQLNRSAQALCSSVEALRTKYPFNGAATQEATIQDLNEVYAPTTGALAQFAQSPEVSKAYVRQGRGWVQNPSFPGTFSQPFLEGFNNLLGFSDALYADGTGSPHFDYTLTLDGTGHVPFELDVDGHTILYNPKKGPVSTRLVWPPATNAPTKLIVKAGLPLPVQNSGLWSLFRLLQAADKQEGNVFIFSTVQFAGGSKIPLQDGKGNPVTIQIRIDSVAANVFSRGYLGKVRCENYGGWAIR